MTIPRGSVITIIGNPKELALVDIEWEGEPLAVFNRDLEEHTEQMHQSPIEPIED